MNTAVLCRIAPFMLYMTFIALEEALRFLGRKGFVVVPDPYLLCLYPVKVLSVALVLFLFRKNYTEIRFRELFGPFVSISSLVAGIVVFVLWINLDQPFATMGTPKGFDPHLFREEGMRLFLTASRLAGAVLVVPVMEELFWRSFLIRYVISPDFRSIPIGRFTWQSFLITAVLFGLEHNLFLAGILAGISYNLILYYTKSLIQCILAHAVTNLILGIYVLNSGRWEFW